jgi:integrase
MKLFVLLMSTMALRFAEAAAAAPEHYDAQAHTLTIRTKGGRVRTFPVPPSVDALFSLAPTNGHGTYVERLLGKTIRNLETLRIHWYALTKAAGIRKEIRPHDLRRTAAVHLYTQTLDVLAAKEMLGHDSLNATMHYLKPYDQAAMRQIQQHMWRPKGAPN